MKMKIWNFIIIVAFLQKTVTVYVLALWADSTYDKGGRTIDD